MHNDKKKTPKKGPLISFKKSLRKYHVCDIIHQLPLLQLRLLFLSQFQQQKLLK